MTSTTAKCTIGPRHKWAWTHDVTHRNVTMNARGTQVKLSRRGWYKCECGAKRLGSARSGL